ncbi:siphovirus ReqiPepy6 Gp37-like family protein [Tissierella creatinophila]|uniref:Gp28/Gp37-like domain-containing protein n=1 Tax=Tissierella creatinophila DSM 6911 TaxID=1123403 RepID=A0A1U7M6E7_TISCR|nr:siphovirus ReqiPepy6 Gp37-like family protein [Tissierella creatinophila]OLS02877.1 hypothetical protein TICRE_11500 [Tissierella creatinophila DSM 6911]
MELYIFDRELNFKGVIEDYFSFIWTRRYCKCGEFELHCNLSMENLNILKKGNIVWKKGDKEAGYIQYRNLHQDETGKEILVIKGKFLTNYIGRRIVWDRKNISSPPEMAIREIVNDNCINPSKADRKIPLLVLGELKNYLGSLDMQVSYKNVLETIEDISEVNELGIRTLFNYKNKKLIFDIYKSVDRTAGQNINAPAIFSEEFENILEQEYTDSDIEYRNTALIAGEGEGEQREKVFIEVGQGLDRYELYVDARDLQSTKTVNDNEVPIPIAEYRKILNDRGLSKLDEHKKIETFDSKINLKSNLEYKKDFDLGDRVTITSKKWRITIDTRITEIEEVYEEKGLEINIVFGNNIPTLIDKIKREVR